MIATESAAMANLVLSRVLVICPVIVHQADKFEVVPLSTFEIIRIVGWGNLDRSGTKLHIDSDSIGNDRDASTVEWMNDEFAVQMGVSGVFGVDSNGGITEHGFGTGSCDDNLLV